MALRTRRLALAGLAKILDAPGLEELFACSDDEATFLYDLLVDTVQARGAAHYAEIRRTARRRGVTPDYVVDRAVVLLGAMAERRRTDLYRILGVAPLSSGDVIRQRWLDVARATHPDVGGDGVRFRQVKQAYEILRDPAQRTEYERFWVRALRPFERVLPAEAPPAKRAVPPRPTAPRPPAAPVSETAATVFWSAARMLQERDALDRRFEEGGISALLSRLETALAPVERAELDALRAEVDRLITRLDAWRDGIAGVAALKRRLAV